MTKRRYPRGENQIYDKVYNQRLTHSPIVNQAIREKNERLAFKLNSEGGIRSEIIHLEGNPAGKVFHPDRDEFTDAAIPAVEKELARINFQIENWTDDPTVRQKQLLPGTNITSLSVLHETRFKLEAIIDVYRHEVKRLREMLVPYEEHKLAQRKKALLEFGPLGEQQRFFPRQIIDGQECGFVNGVLCVTDDLSPYQGMNLADYKTFVVKQFKREQKELCRKKTKQREDEIMKYGKSFIRIPEGHQRISKENLPKWPEGIKNHLKKQKQEEIPSSK